MNWTTRLLARRLCRARTQLELAERELAKMPGDDETFSNKDDELAEVTARVNALEIRVMAIEGRGCDG